MRRRFWIAPAEDRHPVGSALHEFPALRGETEGIGIGDAFLAGRWRFTGPVEGLDALEEVIRGREEFGQGMVLERRERELTAFLVDPLPRALDEKAFAMAPLRLHVSWRGLFVETWNDWTQEETVKAEALRRADTQRADLDEIGRAESLRH